MPSKSPAQHRLMEAAAHTKGGVAGVPQAVGKEFVAADSAMKHHMAEAHKGHHHLVKPAHPGHYGR
jgi:hypothetical protein